MSIFSERLRQKYHTLNWPQKEPQLSPLYRGKPVLDKVNCGDCAKCLAVCPVNALVRINGVLRLDLGRCIFCGQCAAVCQEHAISFSHDYRMAVRSREDLYIFAQDELAARPEPATRAYSKNGIFGRSFKLRQVSAGGCNACEADCNVLGTLVYDLSRFGVEFTASPRHADAIVLTGPITRNMLPALFSAWEAVPAPRILISVGACAISGGLFAECEACMGGMDICAGLPEAMAAHFQASIYIPGCPPNPWSILDGLLLGREPGH